MNMSQNNNSYRIGRRAGQQGPRPSVRNQAEVEKSATGTNSPVHELEVIHAENVSHNGPHVSTSQNQSKSNRQKWSREEYKEVMEAYYYITLNPLETSTTEAMYNLWRQKHPNTRLYIDANKLGNVKRDIIRNKRLTDLELEDIKMKACEMSTSSNSCDSNNTISVDPVEVEENGFCSYETSDTCENSDTPEVEPVGEKVLEMKDNILRKIEIVKEMLIHERPALPKIKIDHHAKDRIEIANKAIFQIKKELGKPLDLTEVNCCVYATASVISESLIYKPKFKKKGKSKHLVWKEKFENGIKHLRGELSLLTEIRIGNTVNQKKKVRIFKKYNIKSSDDVIHNIEILKQKLQAKAQRFRRFTKRSNFFRQNKIFREDAKKFYRELGKNKIEVNNPPTTEEVETFWSNIWENEKEHNRNASWIKQQENQLDEIEIQPWSPISIAEAKASIARSSNWKAPGIDKISNFWIKYLHSTHEDLTSAFNDIVLHPEKCPIWLTQGNTFLLPKTEDTQNPKNYRPITCLPTMFKILTSILTDRTYSFLDKNNLLPSEQKGCKKGSYGCKDQLLINKTILEETKRNKKNLSTAWIDYKKAFDSVPHSWIRKCLEIYKICPVVVRFISESMRKWQTTLNLYHTGGLLTSRPININCGIFQGDSFSPLLFCLALAPLSNLLNNSGYGYEFTKGKVSHLFYMDDLKTFAKDDNQQIGLLSTVKTFSDDIKMEFGLDKCAKATFKRGKLCSTSNIVLDVNTTIKQLNQEETYKYLGVHEGEGIQHSMMKEKIRKEYYRRVRLVLKSELNATNKFTAINTLAIPVVAYSFNIINWKLSDLKKLDVKTRKFLTMERMHHPKADVDRLYLPRSDGGRGLVQLELSFKTTTIGLDTYLSNTNDQLLSIVKSHDSKKKLFSIKKDATKFKKELNVPEMPSKENETSTVYARRTKTKAKSLGLEVLMTNWKDKALHGKYPKRISEADVDYHQTNKWLKATGLKSETEGLIIAAQDQSLSTRSYHHHIIKDGTDPLCRICGQFEETINHIVSGCPQLAKSEYINRHDKAGTYLHWKICRANNIKTTDKWYEHEPPTVTENNDITILWDMPIHTDREIKANRPDIVIKNRNENTCLLIDMSIPSDLNTSIKVSEKLSKYKDLEIEINRMWGMKTEVIPVVIGALGLVKKGLEKFTNKIPGNINIDEIQKIALLGTAHILRRVLSIK